VEKTIAELVGEQENLAAMVRFVGEHVGEHGGSRGPDLAPTAAREFGDAAIGRSGQRIGQHAQTLSCAFFVRGGGLLDGATVGVERRGTFQVGRGISEPGEPAVMEMREDRGDAATAAFFTGRIGAPRARIESGEDELVHGVVGGVGFEERVADFGQGGVGLGSGSHGGWNANAGFGNWAMGFWWGGKPGRETQEPTLTKRGWGTREKGIRRWRDDRREWPVISGEWREKAEEKDLCWETRREERRGIPHCADSVRDDEFSVCDLKTYRKKNATEKRQAA
jgi:hypothetical protein